MGSACPECKGTNLTTDLIENKVGIVCADCGTLVEDEPSSAKKNESNNDLTSGSPAPAGTENVSFNLTFATDQTVHSHEYNDGDRNNDDVPSGHFSDGAGGSICQSCRGKNVVAEIVNDSEQLVCRDCGYFVEEQHLISHGEYAQISGKGEAVYGWSRAPKPKFARERQHVPKGKLSGIQTTRDVCAKLKLRPELEEQAVALFEKMYAEDKVAFLRTLHKDTMGVCCAYTVARQNGVHVTVKTLQKIHPMKVKFLNKCIRLIREVTKQPLQHQRLDTLVPHVLSGYNFSDALKEKVCTLVTVSEQGFLAQGRDYTNIIVTLAYLVWISEDVNNRKYITYSKFCEQHGIRSTQHAQNLVSLTKQLLVTLADQLPWVRKKVTKNTVVFYISDIVKYNRSVLSRAAKQTEDAQASTTGSPLEVEQSSDSNDSTATNRSVSLLFPPAMRKSSNTPGILRTDLMLPDHIDRADLDKEDLGDTEFDDEMASHILSPDEVEVKREKLKL
ncbi:hypothetical protein BaRGS_00020469 [Batillaria attramentaria]|uniref:Transcription factor IIIB 50 kDa subunit n=1 Tax=Batillaria attramentaria TaxID=370345 RepID=A0ABD0KM65_9CAEN